MNYCYRCGADTGLSGKTGFNQVCPACNAYLHCCKNCRFFDGRASGGCREPQAELVSDKEKGNHCEYFEFVAGSRAGTIGQDKQKKARTQFDSLFKK